MSKHISDSPDQTQEIACALVEQLLGNQTGKALVIALEGELGAGKTTFAQAFAKALGVKQNLKSPTFVLMKHYKLEAKNYKLLYHLDCYRLQSPKDLGPLGLAEILKHPGNIILIEWAERVKGILPRGHIKINFEHVDEKTRKVRVS